jgi:hypothetical protein
MKLIIAERVRRPLIALLIAVPVGLLACWYPTNNTCPTEVISGGMECTSVHAGGSSYFWVTSTAPYEGASGREGFYATGPHCVYDCPNGTQVVYYTGARIDPNTPAC